jgi:phosphatidate cytidylyltransferase
VKPILTRTLSGAIYILLILGSVILGSIPFGLVLLFFLILCQLEYLKMFTNAGIPVEKFSFLIAGLGSYLISLLIILNLLDRIWLVLIIPLIFSFYITELFRKKPNPVSNINFGIGGLVYLGIPFILLNVFLYPDLNFSHHSISLLLGFFIIIWANDTFAYLSGMFFGKHKFFERISPKKTWEGTAGGLVFGLITGYILSLFFDEFSSFEWLGYALTIIIFGTFGDLFESLMKRTLGLKDSGNIMPGHGGILDRFDSILLAVPFAFIYIVFVLN